MWLCYARLRMQANGKLSSTMEGKCFYCKEYDKGILVIHLTSEDDGYEVFSCHKCNDYL